MSMIYIMIEYYIICGYIGTSCFTISLLPQIYKIYKTKKAGDISYGWQCFYLFGGVCSLIFSCNTPYIHLRVGISVEICNICSIIYLKQLYSKKRHIVPDV